MLREHFTGDDPSDRTPGRGEEGDVDADESDQNLLSDKIGGGDRDTDDGDEEFAGAHTGSTDQEQPPTAEPLDTLHARKRREAADDVGGNGDQEGVRNIRVLEEHGAVVEDEVDTGQLLPGLDEDTGEGTETDFVVTRAETVGVRRLANFHLLLGGKTDLVKFGLELGMVGWEGNETREGTGGIGVATLLDEPSRRLGEEVPLAGLTRKSGG